MKPERIVILTGAGISAESGINTFRGSDGLWENHRVEDVATPEAFARDPHLVQRFYNERRAQLRDPAIAPNAGHAALARLEQAFDGDVLLVTQNIDNLHERAGSDNLIHMHGELFKAHCQFSGEVYAVEGDLTPEMPCPCCNKPGGLRPHVVWFGEMPLQLERIFDALARCDLFASIGTSGKVYPAAGFVQAAAEAGAHTVEINLEASDACAAFAEQRYGPAGTEVPAWVDGLLGH